MNENALSIPTWLQLAKSGDRLEYWRGFIARDIGDLKPGERLKQLALAKRDAWEAYDEGFAELAQRRHGPGDYSYFIIKRAHRLVPPPKLRRVEGGERGGGYAVPALQGPRPKVDA